MTNNDDYSNVQLLLHVFRTFGSCIHQDGTHFVSKHQLDKSTSFLGLFLWSLDGGFRRGLFHDQA